MRAALREAVRVSAGPVLVIEPLAEGSFFEAVRLVDDETEVRALAQAALTDAITAGDVTLVRMEEYEDHRAFSGPEALLRKIVEVDPPAPGSPPAGRRRWRRWCARWPSRGRGLRPHPAPPRPSAASAVIGLRAVPARG